MSTLSQFGTSMLLVILVLAPRIVDLFLSNENSTSAR